MSEQNKALVRKIYQATETGDAAILDSVVTEDVIEHPLNPGQPPGREALKQIFGGFSVIVPDLRITVEDIIAGGNRAAVRSTVTGTPAGPYLGVDPAGRPMRFEAIDIWHIEDGLVAEGWHVEDFVAALMGWGAVTFASRPPSAAARWMSCAAGIRRCARLIPLPSARSSTTISSTTARSAPASP